MRKSAGLICGLAAACGLLTMTFLPSAKAQRPIAIEKEFLGVRMLQTYKQVLGRYGAPVYIFRNGETLQFVEARNLKGELTGGILGIESGGSSTGGGGGGGQMPGGGGPPASAGGGGGGVPPQYAQYARQGQGGRGPQGGGMPGSSGGAGSSGGPTASGASGTGGGGGGVPGGGGGGGSQADGEQTFGASGGFYWVYLYPKQELAYVFFFNKDGRVEAIIERGRLGGQKTSRGIGLNDSIDAVYKTYGWTDSIKLERDNIFSLFYNDKYHAQIMTLKNRVVGVIVALRENQRLRFFDSSGGSASAGGGGGRLPGGGGAPGSSGGRSFPGAGGKKNLPGVAGQAN